MVEARPLTVEEICNKLRPIFGKKIDEVYFQYAVADSREDRDEIAHILNALYQKNLNELLGRTVLLPPPPKKLIDGDYEIGTVSYAGRKLFPFTLREKDWQRHICITGMSGSGKTTVAFHIIETLKRHKKKFLIFDWKKSFRPLLKSDSSIMIFTVGDSSVSNLFKTNINRPPKGVAPKEWINVLADLLTESFLASFGVHKVLLETLDESFKEWGIYNGSENYPTWNHIRWRLEEKMEKIQGREAGWIESALRIATVLTFGEFGKVVNYKGKSSISVEDLLDQKVIMELNALGNIEKKFFCEFLLTYIYRLKKVKQNKVNTGFDHAIIVDEAHNIFLKKPTSFSNESVTDMIYREMREYGTSLICLDQHISKISDTVKGNSACQIAFQQQLPQDIQDISELMQLRESRHFFSELPVGSAIVKLVERYNSPFLIEVSWDKIRDQSVNDEEVKSRMQAMMINQGFKNKEDLEFSEEIQNKDNIIESVVVGEDKKVDVKKSVAEKNDAPVKEVLDNKTPEGFSDVQKKLYGFVLGKMKEGVGLEEVERFLEDNKDRNAYSSGDIMKVINTFFGEQFAGPSMEKFKSEKVVGNVDSNLSNDQREFVEFLRKNPDHNKSTVEVYLAVGLSPRKGTKIKNELLDKGLIRIEEIKYDKGWKKLIRLNHSP